MRGLTSFLRRNWAIMLILALGVFLRLENYMGVIRGDDAPYYYLGYKLATAGQLSQSLWGGQERIGLYYPVAVLIQLFGATEFTATLFPLLASLSSIGFVYGIGESQHSKPAGLIAAFLWAVFPLDVFLATQLIPDGPSAMAALGTIFFFSKALMAARQSSRVLNLLGAVFFAIWAFLIKESMIVLGLISAGLFVFQQRHRALDWLSFLKSNKRARYTAWSLLTVLAALFLIWWVPFQSPVLLNLLELTSVDIADLLLLGSSNPVQLSNVGPYWLVDRPAFSLPPQPEVLALPTNGVRIEVFDVFAPILLFAVAAALVNKQPASQSLLLWFLLAFLYLEWGSYPRGLALQAIATYTPITHWIDPRNLISLWPPLVLLIGVYIASILKNEERYASRSVLVASFLVCIVQGLLKLGLIDFHTLHIAKLLAVLIPLILAWLGRSKSFSSVLSTSGLLIVLGVASLVPTPHFHVSMYAEEQARRQNLRAVLEYLSYYPDALVYGQDSSLAWLDTYANFEYGYDHLGIEGANAGRVIQDRKLLLPQGGFTLRYGCDSAVPDFEQWPVREFGEAPECISLGQLFPESDLADVQQALRAAAETGSDEDIAKYLSASAQLRDFPGFVNGLALAVDRFPNELPLVQAADILSAHEIWGIKATRIDLLQDFLSCPINCEWAFGERLEYQVRSTDNGNLLTVKVADKTEEPQSITLTVALQPGHAYLLEIELRSFAPFDLVRVNSGEILDSYLDSWSRQPEWTTYKVVFVTPLALKAGESVNLELARVFDRGEIEFRSIELFQIETE